MLKVAVVGGGIGGLAAARALVMQGHEVRVYERAAAIREVGSGLTLWSNATRVLHNLGILGDCLKTSCPIKDFHLLTAAGQLIMRIPVEQFATTAMVMHRADLQALLLRSLPAGVVQTDAECLGIRATAGRHYLEFSDSERGPFDLVVGADGIKSALRHFVRGEVEPPSYRGYFIWRGVGLLNLPDYPAGRTSETWGQGRRFGILPMGHGRVCWYATANQPLSQTSQADARHTLVHELTKGWHSPIPELIEATPHGAILENPAFDRGVQRGWSRGGVVLVGDAAHPITPNLGQGGCMALEDAVVLASLLPGHQNFQPEALAAKLRQFEELRYSRIRSMERRCRILGAIGQWQHPLMARARVTVARLIPGAYFTLTSRAIQKYRAECVAIAKSKR
jgi:2-polyprenyl-6-methoxyphenol hydroxylase-like FAD-dependent oxidoreductase